MTELKNSQFKYDQNVASYLQNGIVNVVKIKLSLLLIITLSLSFPVAQAQTNATGTLAPKDYPWIGKLLIEKNMDGSLCTSSLIDSSWVLTAAHCVVGRKNFQVLLGGNLNEGGTIADVDYSIANPNYNNVTKEADIALLHLRSEVDYFHTNLPPKNDDSLLKNRMYSIGWGRDENLNFSDALKYSYMDLHKSTMPASSIIRAGYLDPVSKKYSTTCYGDSGGPLVAKGNKSVVLGIASYTADNCVGIKPAGFTRVSSYLDWIDSAQKLVNADIARRSNFEKTKTPDIKIEFIGQTPYINFTENGDAKKYVVNCFIDDGDYYGFSSNDKTVKIANYTVDVVFGCTGQYINSLGKESIPSKQVLLKIPKYNAPNNEQPNPKPKPSEPQTLPTRISSSTTNSSNPYQVDATFSNQSERLGGLYVMYNQSSYYVFEYYNPFSKPSYSLVMGDGTVLYDMYYSGSGSPSFSIKQRVTGKSFACSAELSNFLVANKSYQKLSISRRCLSDINITQLSFRVIENNKYFDIKFTRLID